MRPRSTATGGCRAATWTSPSSPARTAIPPSGRSRPTTASWSEGPRMCGISGEVRFDGRRADLAAVCRMAAAEQSRGPDGSGLWNDGWAALGHRRLSIIDLSANGAQPMADDALGVAVAFNGCIYNYRELREQLRAAGYTFRSTSDTEVVLAAYHRWREHFAEHLVGMFAVAIVDRDADRLVLARDRL